jgi:hypothetical protein
VLARTHARAQHHTPHTTRTARTTRAAATQVPPDSILTRMCGIGASSSDAGGSTSARAPGSSVLRDDAGNIFLCVFGRSRAGRHARV